MHDGGTQPVTPLETLLEELLQESDLASTWVPDAASDGGPAQAFRRSFPGVTLVLTRRRVSVDLWVLDPAGNPSAVFTDGGDSAKSAGAILHCAYPSPEVARLAQALYQKVAVRFSADALVDVALGNLRPKGR